MPTVIVPPGRWKRRLLSGGEVEEVWLLAFISLVPCLASIAIAAQFPNVIALTATLG